MLAGSAPALAATSHAELWTGLGGRVTCGVAIHVRNTPPMRILCSDIVIPAPKGHGVGDPGFVFLGVSGHPSLARLSQDSFEGTSAVALASGRTWRQVGGVTCTISTSAVRCANRSHHGFTIGKNSYHPF